jgi:DNA-binding NarL/FixJ family response regulator
MAASTVGTLGAAFRRLRPPTVALERAEGTPTGTAREALERNGIFVRDGSLSGRIDAVVVHASGHRDAVLEFIVAVHREREGVPLVAIWPDRVPVDERRALRAGVDCLVLESTVTVGLPAAVYAACAGLVCLPQRPSTAERVSALSRREREVLTMLLGGATNAQIGRALFLAESTVKCHVSSAYAKLGVRSRKDAAALLEDLWQPPAPDTLTAA